jgi:phage baseplate assembly protein W
MGIYKGYSSIGTEFSSIRLEDSDLIKRDLLNHFAIRKGEKLTNPDFGSSINDLIMEPLTESTKNALLEEIQSIIDADPRVSLQELLVDEIGNGLQAQIGLFYVKTNQTETMLVTFLNQDGQVRTSTETL